MVTYTWTKKYKMYKCFANTVHVQREHRESSSWLGNSVRCTWVCKHTYITESFEGLWTHSGVWKCLKEDNVLLQVVFSNLCCIICQCWQFENGGKARFVKCKAKKRKRRAQFSIRAELTQLSVCVRFRYVCRKLLTQRATVSANNPESFIHSPRAFGQSLYRVLIREIEREVVR